MTVVALTAKTERKANAKAKRVARVTRAVRRMHSSAVILGAVAVVLMGLSLTHLAAGIETVTRCSTSEAWAMAFGIDLGFISLEIASVTVIERIRRKIEGLIKHTLIGLMIGSSALNGLAFGMNAEGWLMYVAVPIGLAIPVMIYRISRVSSAMWLG